MTERRAALRNYIQAKGEVSTAELLERFAEKSPATIRRDLSYLEKTGCITRTHGMARVNRQSVMQPEAFYSEREGENARLKQAIAARALSLIEERRSLFLDSGTTLMAFARALPDVNLSVLTAAPNIALYIAAQKPTCTALLTGGTLNPKTLSCSGYGSAEALNMLNIDIAFMGASGFSVGSGFTVGEYFECELKRTVMSKSVKSIVLMDSSKIGKSMPYTFARPSDINIVVTDGGIDPKTRRALTDKGVTLLICDE
ncbi:MAG: DeoR/GlpR family DNA-binding transcription regulator [Oscillospiraceae bacterium]|nr:DeoR/GlpR family DNA-binding transcription regulator [Oscillospiraceae bacterium]